VMPFGTLSRKPHTGFRTGEWASLDSQGLLVAFDESWDLSSIRGIFPMTSCVVRGAHAAASGLMPTVVIPWSPPRNGAKAAPLPTREIAAIDAGAVAASPYERLFRAGAILYPRMLLFVERAPVGPLAPGAGRVEVRSARSTQEKPPWKEMPSLNGIVEDRFLTDVHLGETIAPFRDLGARLSVLPVDPARGILTEAEVAQHPALNAWWTRVEDTWGEGRVASETDPLIVRMDYHGQLSAQFPIRPHRVVYTASGNALAAARIDDDDASVIEHKLYWASCTSIEEARYLTAILNSQALLAQVAMYQAVGLFGPRDFDKYAFQIDIPLYDPLEPSHQELAQLAAEAEVAAATVQLPAGIRFIDARSRINAHLSAIGILPRIDAAVAALLPPP
jgi:hypothetical protein